MSVTHKDVVGLDKTDETGVVDGLDWAADHNAPASEVTLFREGATAIVITNLPAALAELSTNIGRTRTYYDMSYVTSCRVVVGQSIAASVSTEIRVQYSLDNGTTWAYLDGVAGPSSGALGTTANQNVRGPWVPLVAAARADVLLRVVTINGNGTADPAFWFVTLQVQ